VGDPTDRWSDVYTGCGVRDAQPGDPPPTRRDDVRYLDGLIAPANTSDLDLEQAIRALSNRQRLVVELQRRARRHWLVPLLAAAVLIAGVVIGGSVIWSSHPEHPAATGSPTTPRGPSAQVRAKLWSLALRQATLVGDPHISTAQAVRTSKGAAMPVTAPGDTAATPPDNNGVWIIQVQGEFTGASSCFGVSRPVPSGHVIGLMVDATSYNIWSFSLGDDPVDLSRLGTVVQLSAPTAAAPAHS
jgi:hypothetical protein